MPLLVKLLLLFGILLPLLISMIVSMISKPERGWTFYFVFIGLLPFYMEAMSLQRTGSTNPYGQAFLPTVILTMMIFVIWLCNQIVMRKEISFEKGPLFYPFLFFILANVLSLFNANDIESGIIIIFAWIYIFLTYLAIYNTMNKFSHIESFVKIFITICIVLSIYGLYLWLSGMSTKGINPFGKVGMLESNHFAFILAEGMFLSMLLSIFSDQRFRSRIFYLTSFVLMLFTLIFTFSRGAWVSCGVVLFWLIFVQSIKGGKNIKLASYGLIALSIAFIVIYFHPATYNWFLTILKGKEASMPRYEMDVAAWNTFLEHPLIGIGINNFVVHTHALGGRASYGTCNLYSRMLAETGIIGFVAFIALMLTIYRVLSKGVRVAVPGSREQLIQLGFLSGFLANAIDFLFFAVIFPFWWVLFFVGIASTKFTEGEYNVSTT